jgi:hypothetical protein
MLYKHEVDNYSIVCKELCCMACALNAIICDTYPVGSAAAAEPYVSNGLCSVCASCFAALLPFCNL